MTAPVINNGTFDLESLKAFANQPDKNAKVLVNQSTGTVSIKGPITSRLIGTKGARLEAANIFLETLKREYGETIALELSQDADVASLRNGKPLSARRILSVLARAEARLQQLEGRIHEAEFLMHDFKAKTTIKKFGAQFGDQLSLNTFFPEIENAEKMVKELKAVLDKRDAKLAVDIGTIKQNPPESFQKAHQREAVNVLSRLGLDLQIKGEDLAAVMKDTQTRLLEHLPKEGTVTPMQYAECLRAHPEVFMSSLLGHLLRSDFPELAEDLGISTFIDTLRKDNPALQEQISGCKDPEQFRATLKAVKKEIINTYVDNQSVDVEILQYSDSLTPPIFKRVAAELGKEMLKKLGLDTINKSVLDTALVSALHKIPYPKDQKTVSIREYKALFETAKPFFIIGCLKQDLSNKFPNFQAKTAFANVNVPISTLCKDDPTLTALVQQCSSRGDYDAIVEKLSGMLQKLETKAEAIRQDFKAAYEAHVDEFTELSKIDRARVAYNLEENSHLHFQTLLTKHISEFVLEDLPLEKAKESIRQDLDKEFAELKEQLGTIQALGLPPVHSTENLILYGVCCKRSIKGKLAELLGQIAKDEHLCPKDLAKTFLNIHSKTEYFSALRDAVKSLGPIIEQHIQTVYDGYIGSGIGSDDHDLIALVLTARLMQTYQGPNVGPKFLTTCDDFLREYKKIGLDMESPPVIRAIDKLIQDNTNVQYTMENLTEGLEMAIASHTNLEIQGMKFDALKAKAELIFNDTSISDKKKQNKVDDLIDQYIEDQDEVISAIQKSTLSETGKARFYAAVRDLGACDHTIFDEAMTGFFQSLTTKSFKGFKPDANGLLKLMKGFEASYKTFASELENAPDAHAAAFLKRCGLAFMSSDNQISNAFAGLNNGQFQALRQTLQGKLAAAKEANARTALQSALEFLDVLRPQNA